MQVLEAPPSRCAFRRPGRRQGRLPAVQAHIQRVSPVSRCSCAAMQQVFDSHQAAARFGDRGSQKVGCPLCKRPVKWDAIFRAASATRPAAGQAGAAAQDVDPDDPGMAEASPLSCSCLQYQPQECPCAFGGLGKRAGWQDVKPADPSMAQVIPSSGECGVVHNPLSVCWRHSNS